MASVPPLTSPRDSGQAHDTLHLGIGWASGNAGPPALRPDAAAATTPMHFTRTALSGVQAARKNGLMAPAGDF